MKKLLKMLYLKKKSITFGSDAIGNEYKRLWNMSAL